MRTIGIRWALLGALLWMPYGARVQTPAAEPPPPKFLDIVQTHLNAARKLSDAGKVQEGLAETDEALAAAREANDVVGEARALMSRAEALTLLKRLDEAGTAWREANRVWERVDYGPGRVGALIRASLLVIETDPASARLLLEQALKQGASETTRPLMTANALKTLGLQFLPGKHLEEARQCWHGALLLIERTSPNSMDAIKILNNLGLVSVELGDMVTAKSYFVRILPLQEILQPDTMDQSNNLQNLGNTTLYLGDLTSADYYYQRVYAIRQKLGPNTLGMAACLGSLGKLANTRGDLEKAERYYLDALALQEKLVPDSEDIAVTLDLLGFLVLERGDLSSAEDFFIRARSIMQGRNVRSLTLSNALDGLGIVERYRGHYASAIQHFNQSLALRGKLSPDSIWVAESYVNIGNTLFEKRDMSEAQRYQEIAQNIYKKMAPGSSFESVSLYNLSATAREMGKLKLAEEYGRRALAIEEKLSPGSLSLAGRHKNLGYIYLLAKRFPEALVSFQTSAAILESQRSKIGTPDNRTLLIEKHTDIYAGLLQAHLALGDKAGAFHALERAHARSFLDRLAERDLDLSRFASPQLLQKQKTLDQQRRETYFLHAGALRTHDDNQENVTRQAVFAQAAHARILHFACHGWADDTDPLGSALALTPEGEGDDGFLRAWEVLEKMRLHADLVTLCACETGLGVENKSEGILGLTRAFQLAGARRVLMSLWRIQDVSANALMLAFYRQVKAGASMDRALQNAQIALLKSKPFRHPHFWAPFVLSGYGVSADL